MKIHSPNFYHSKIAKVDRKETNAMLEKILQMFSKKYDDFDDYTEYCLVFIECLIIGIATEIDISSKELFVKALEKDIAPIWTGSYSHYRNRLSHCTRIGIKGMSVIIEAYDAVTQKESLMSLSEIVEILQLEIDMAPYRVEIYKAELPQLNSMSSGRALPFFESFVPFGTNIVN
jgi:hypothetical protein